MSLYFKATAENYFGRVSKAGIIEALREAQIEITPAMEKAKKGDLPSATSRRPSGCRSCFGLGSRDG